MWNALSHNRAEHSLLNMNHTPVEEELEEEEETEEAAQHGGTTHMEQFSFHGDLTASSAVRGYTTYFSDPTQAKSSSLIMSDSTRELEACS